MTQNLKLWYNQPAECHEESLPIGNGSFGAMIFGGIHEETLALNADTLWSGFRRDKNRPEAREYLPQARQLISEGKLPEAERLIQDHMLGEYTESYLPLGTVRFAYTYRGEGETACYRRELCLNDAVASVSYSRDDAAYQREYFASYPDQAVFARLTCSRPEMSVAVRFDSPLVHTTEIGEGGLRIVGQCPEHVDPPYCPREDKIIQGTKGQHFSAACQLLFTDGAAAVDRDALCVSNASVIMLALFMGDKPAFHPTERFETFKKRHIDDYQRLFNTVDLYLGEQDTAPTDVRLERLRKDDSDPSLYALYFQYGRYLLISSSRHGSQPANLQGIWAWEMISPWSSNWTTNINLQMNYWPACSCNLLECMEPYFALLQRICANGKESAQAYYGCRGSVLHHNTDYWASTNPTGIFYGGDRGYDGCVTWSFWPMGEAWLCRELFQYYEYTQDKEFLRHTVYPILRENALFLCDWLVEKDGFYGTMPSTSPENRFLTPEGDSCCVTRNCALDLELTQEVFQNFRKTCEILNMDDALLRETDEKLSRLTPLRTGSCGQLLEWGEEYREQEPGHRHMSHLYGVYPSELFAREPRLLEAARKSLDLRIQNGGGYTGWSCAWLINLYSVLEDAENAYRFLHTLLSRSTYDNLWDAHPPFQIDGNFGGTAGIANMLVQDRGGNIKILPALPEKWKNGYVKGLRVKGKRTIDIEWQNGTAKKVKIHAAQ